MQQDTSPEDTRYTPPDPSPGAPALAALLPPAASGPPEHSLLADRPDGTVVRVGCSVAKAHAPGTDAGTLVRRLRIAADPAVEGILLAPLSTTLAGRLADGRPATAWPYGVPVDPDVPEAAPWEAAGALLARLHSVPLEEFRMRHGRLPAMGGPAKVAAAVRRMRAALPGAPAACGGVPAARSGPTAGRLRAARETVERAWDGLPAWCRGEEEQPDGRPRTLCHGDFHLGQLVRHPAVPGRWHLIDIDDLGAGDPAWDLARPAAWYASGLLPPVAWGRLLAGYRRHRPGPAENVWPWLDQPARALTVQTAALAVAKAAEHGRLPDEDEEALLAACSRIVELRGPMRP